jgi:hypothetical protein
MQYGTTATTFIPAGDVGSILQSQGTTATWISTSSLLIGRAAEALKPYVSGLTTAEITPTRYLTMSSGVNGYYDLGAISDLAYNTNNKVLTVSITTVTSLINPINSQTGALVVAGGVGIGGNLWVGGEIIAEKLTIELTTVTTTLVTTDDIIQTTNTTNSENTGTGALLISGGAAIGLDLHVGGTIYGTFAGALTEATTATNLANGTQNQIPYQAAAGTTLFFGPGTAGDIVVSRGTSGLGPTFISTNTLYVGNAGLADNLKGGTGGAIPFQTATDQTVFLSLGSAGYVLTAGATAPYWSPLTDVLAGSATTATNLANGSKGQIPYQTEIGLTDFFGPGTPGQIIVSGGGISAPTFQNTLTVTTIGIGGWFGGIAGEIRASSEITAYYASDERLKENIQLIENPITIIEKIRGVRFDWTDWYIDQRGGEDDYFVRKQDIGVIAQEIEEVLPEVVAERSDGFKAVKYEKIIPLLIEAIKELSREIKEIKNNLQ